MFVGAVLLALVGVPNTADQAGAATAKKKSTRTTAKPVVQVTTTTVPAAVAAPTPGAAPALARPAFGPYLSLLGTSAAYEPAAVTIISFGLTWLAMIMIALIGRGGRARVVVAGGR